MGDPAPAEILQNVKKDSTARLRAELTACFPTSLTVDQIGEYSRTELVDLVYQCRVFLKQTGKASVVLEGKLTLKLPTAGAAAAEAVPTDPMSMMLAFMKVQEEKEERRLAAEKAEREAVRVAEKNA